MSKEYLVFANYFNGWWRGDSTKWAWGGRDWRLEYPGRIPLAGCYNGADTMRAEIDCASGGGVDCFVMLWYHAPEKSVEGVEHLNRGVEDFMNSPNAGKMSFMIEDCNHLPFLTESEAGWDKIASYFVDCMKHPSYMRVGGKALFKIHGLTFFYRETGGDIGRARRRIDFLRDRAMKEGVGELLVSAGAEAEGSAEYRALFDYFSSYAADIPVLPETAEKHPYRYLKEAALETAEKFKGKFPYMPFVMGGWDPAPWHDPRPSFGFPSESEWRDMLIGMKKLLNENEELGIPCGKGRQKAFNIYAWNEYGEGSILAPTLGDGDMKLRVLKEVFSGDGRQ